jgi:pyruvate dehydrogenase E2 component (dihydrolipoamide acetyltransferase)
MRYEVRLPDLGEETTEEASITYWLVEEGDEVMEGQDLVELTTDKAAFSLPSPKKGVLSEQVVGDGDEVKTGDVLAVLEIEA